MVASQWICFGLVWVSIVIVTAKRPSPMSEQRTTMPSGPAQPRQSQRELEREEVLPREIKPRDRLDAAQPLAQRVGMDEELAGGRPDVAVAGQIRLERAAQVA